MNLKTKAQEIAHKIQGPTVILLSGPMGSGKTTLVAELVQHLGGKGVSSPTYAFHHQYKVSNGVVDHWDLFRVKTLEELDSLAFWDLLESSSLTLIEWPDLVRDRIPRSKSRIEVSL